MKAGCLLAIGLAAALWLAGCSPRIVGGTVNPGASGTACPTPAGGSIPSCKAPGAQSAPVGAAPSTSLGPLFGPGAGPAPDLMRMDSQGALRVDIRPLNLDRPGETLEFEVTITAETIDPGLDLAVRSVLSTDTGRSAPALKWEPAQTGVPLSGLLSFPAAPEGVPLLASAKSLTVTIRDFGAARRQFVWDLP